MQVLGALADDELSDFASLYKTLLKTYQQDEEAAGLAAGSLPQPENVSAAELAAWVGVSRTLTNLDEFITKE